MTQTLAPAVAPAPEPARFPLHPPARFFDRPEWLEPGQKLSIVADGPDAGRVAGYVATWDTCIIDGSQGCWGPPSSPTAYRGAMQGETLTAEGELIPTANVGGGVNHARLSESFQGAVKHYENAQPLDAKVLTPDGWTTMGALRIGDRVIDPDGNSSVVLGVFPKGERPVYSVQLGDGSRTLATADHLWRVNIGGGSGMRERVVTTEYLLERIARSAAAPIYVKPIQPYDGSGTLPIDPYALGALIGDGGMSQAGLKFTTADPQVASELELRLPAGVIVKHAPTEKRPSEYRIVDMGTHVNKNRVCEALRSLGLKGTRSHEKFLPAACLTLPASERLALLQGLMDTDGHASKEGQAIFATTSRRLADDVLGLLRSLGARGTVKPHKPSMWTSPAQPIQQTGRAWYWINVNLPHGQTPFLLDRKANRYKHRTMYRGHRITSVEPAGSAEVQCIRVSAPSHCYVTDDYMPTHNTAAQTMRVQFGEDDHGIWFAGVAWPELAQDRELASLRASAVSGDWRYRPELGAVDMAGVQLVNNPALPLVKRLRATAALGETEVFVGGLGGAGEIDEEPCGTCATDADRLHDLEVLTAALTEIVGADVVRAALAR